MNADLVHRHWWESIPCLLLSRILRPGEQKKESFSWVHVELVAASVSWLIAPHPTIVPDFRECKVDWIQKMLDTKDSHDNFLDSVIHRYQVQYCPKGSVRFIRFYS